MLTRIIYTFFSILLFSISLLAVFQAPTNFLWKVSIGVTEFPYVFIIITIILFSLMYFFQGFYKFSGSLCIVALLLFNSSIVRAYIANDNVMQSLKKAGISKDSLAQKSPFSLFALFKSNDLTEITPKKLIYKKEGNLELSLDFYSPSKTEKTPCVIVIHGGAWSSGDSHELNQFDNYLAHRGYSVASINYRLAPEFTFPAPLEDLKEVLHFLKSNSSSLNIDTTKFILFGRSAGGQIALLAAYTFNDKSIKGVIAFYAPADMVWAYSIPGNPLIMDSRKVLEDYIGGSYNQFPERYKASSPLEFVNASSPPTLIFHGVRDEMVAYEHSRRLNEKLTKNNVKHALITLPWATHAFDFNPNGPGGQISTFAIEQFLKSIND